MFLSTSDTWVQCIPGIRRFYVRYYGSIRRSFFKVNEALCFVKTPLYVHWLTSYDCNFRCKHCEANAGERSADLLTTEQISRAVSDMGGLGVRTLILTGGEPLLREDILEVASLARERGIRNINLATNGYLVEKFRKELSQAKLSRIHISGDGLEATNDRFRGVDGAFRKALEAVNLFARIGVKERVVNTIVHQNNIGELRGLRDAALNSSATSWNLQIGVPVGRGRSLPYMCLSPEHVRYVFHFIRETRRSLETHISALAGYLGEWDTHLRS